jgi:pimeloyl-ACP methyl ester carboxylesterase
MPMTAGLTTFECTVLAPGGVRLPASVELPEPAIALAILAHGAGSSRDSPRGRAVSGTLHRFGIGSMRVDLLTGRESVERERTFDIDLLAERLDAAVGFAAGDDRTRGLPIALVGASTGAAAALAVAARRPGWVVAVVSRGGRPDLAMPLLGKVRAPTLLIVGGEDEVVLGLNREALARLGAPAELVTVPGATHLFEEPGTLDEVARRAARWIASHARGA